MIFFLLLDLLNISKKEGKKMPGPIEHASVSVGLTALILKHTKTVSDWIIVIIIAIVSLLSHCALDIIPHGHTWAPPSPKLPPNYGNVNFFKLEVVGFLILVSFIFFFRNERWYFLLAIFFGCLQDVLQMKIKWLEDFSIYSHWFQKWKDGKVLPLPWGWYNALILIASLTFLGWTLKLV